MLQCKTMFGFTNRVVFFDVAGVIAEVIFLKNAMDETGGFIYSDVFIYVNIIKTRILVRSPVIFITI